ncbi:hypothetical protein AMTR_s00037p00104880 [Amborella trichopoda]|uniref:Uncharacterized protein n=1 Tax=Amborella trichopoda TaxID=13333 RepID=U5D7D0_AMBTC|nr:hypothetical protein AMTR_s00037p00104880 [Amborella trichopoda]
MVKGGRKSGLGTRGREGSGYGCKYLLEKGGWRREEENGSRGEMVSSRAEMAVGCEKAGAAIEAVIWCERGKDEGKPGCRGEVEGCER